MHLSLYHSMDLASTRIPMSLRIVSHQGPVHGCEFLHRTCIVQKSRHTWYVLIALGKEVILWPCNINSLREGSATIVEINWVTIWWLVSSCLATCPLGTINKVPQVPHHLHSPSFPCCLCVSGLVSHFFKVVSSFHCHVVQFLRAGWESDWVLGLKPWWVLIPSLCYFLLLTHRF